MVHRCKRFEGDRSVLPYPRDVATKRRRKPSLPNLQRGLGWEHVKARKAALKALRPGQPCPYCGGGMWNDARYGWLGRLDLDHLVMRAFGGAGGPTQLAHARCNRSVGGRLGGYITKQKLQNRQSRRW